MSNTKKDRRKLIIFASIICICLIIGIVLIVRGYLTIGWVNDQLDTLEDVLNRSYGPLLYILGTFGFIILQILGVVPVILGPLVYDQPQAFFLTMTGVNIGIITTFLVARYFLRDYFAPKLEASRLNRFTRRLETNGIMTMIFLRLALWMFPPMNWAIGATNIKVRDYIVGSLIGLTPIILAVHLAVSRLKTVNSARDLLRPETIAVLLVFLAFLLTVIWIRRKYFSLKEPRFHEEA
jgi:uncharacterized membrane protein YdjX (TVP38/TMEM64 family)